jgi:hypothetical protein
VSGTTRLWRTTDPEAMPRMTDRQHRAASAIGASECLGTGRSDGAVFLYARHGRRTDRWLVDRSGTVLDRTVLHG